MATYDAILSPFTIGNVTLKNRIVFAPTTLGLPRKQYMEKIESIAKGGVSLIIIGDVPVGHTTLQECLFSRSGFNHYKEITTICHKYDCKVAAQLHRNDTQFQALFKYIPKLLRKKITENEVRQLVNLETGKYISNLPIEEVQKIIDDFGKTAVKAVEAGFDIIQVHGDRMNGSFSSSLFNTRTDCYGGSVTNRARFSCEAVQAIRKLLPSIPIDYKLCVRMDNPHYGNAGILVDEMKEFIPLLEQSGVNSFHVTLANHGKLEDTIPPFNHERFSEEGCFLQFCDEARKYTSLPLCGVGGMSSPDFINKQLESGRIQLAAMSRGLIAEPEWVNKVMNNDEKSIYKCKRCNAECLGGMYNHKGVHCIYDKVRCENGIPKERGRHINF